MTGIKLHAPYSEHLNSANANPSNRGRSQSALAAGALVAASPRTRASSASR